MTTSIRVSSVEPANLSRRREADPAGYRLDVVASDVADIVQSAGGWLYDRIVAGWQVNVLLPPTSDARALRILGVRTRGPGPARSAELGGAGLQKASDVRGRDVLHQ